MTEKKHHSGWFALGLLAECIAVLFWIAAALSLAPAPNPNMCPTLLYFATPAAVAMYLFLATKIGFTIFHESAAAGVSYFLVLAIVALVVGIVIGLFFFDLTQLWARGVAPWLGNPFQRRCF
ncbi:hypothetical protein QM312_05505 [Burkholderia cenocepacia]|uniref:hypothetical protein n=1 Tax=Burkholderia cenocepacia TaxID=95486 RepID=UPI0024B771AA|nr:hypothetical protein [Burkholderia cenocepacia]MDI9695369.1 hypothetical protein [Burkholderia cenocepacia]